GVVRSGLIEAVVETIKQGAVDAEPSAERGFPVTEDVPGHADAGFWEKFGAVDGESGCAEGWVRVDDAVRKGVIGRAALRLIPAIGRFEAETGADFKAGSEMDGVFDVTCAHQRAPAEFGGIGDHGEGFYRSLKEGGERGERCLTVLVLGEIVVGLKTLQPAADLDLMTAMAPEDVIVE